MSARAGIVVTGTEVLTGRIADENGPWLAGRLLESGVEPVHITICGDRLDDIEAQLRFLADTGVDLICTTGGLGPTADDRTVEAVARFCGRELVLDTKLEAQIAEILRGLATRLGAGSVTNFEVTRAANRKQALIPAGATPLDPVGTAPGVVIPGRPVIIVLPGPPRELQAMWPAALRTPLVEVAIAGRAVRHQETIRMFGVPESQLADTLRQAAGSVAGYERMEITTCLRRGELEVVTRYDHSDATVYHGLLRMLREQYRHVIFSEDGSRVDDLVAHRLTGRLIATAESCTAGMLAARLADVPGASSYLLGGVVSYSNTAKTEVLGVDPTLIAEHGAVSEPVAAQMAVGVLRRFGADTAVAITGIAGPGGGTVEKPVGTVCFSVALTDGNGLTRTLRLPGGRIDIRERSTTVALHLLLEALSADRSRS